MYKVVIFLLLSATVSAVPIIIKDIGPFSPVPKFTPPSYSVQLKPVSQLHTLAIPKVYLAPSVVKQSLPTAIPIVEKVPVIPAITKIPVIPTISPLVLKSSPLPTARPIVVKDIETIDPNPGYRYSYAVSDPSTGDNKVATETLENGVVSGSYSLTEPDGTIRKVTYRADDINGFQATVEKIGEAQHLPSLIKKYLGAIPFSSYNHSIKTAIPPYQARPVYHATPSASILPSLAKKYLHYKS